jgi:hypothetical protein
MERFFVIVGRINSVLLLAVLLCAAGGLLYMGISALERSERRDAAVDVVADTPGPVKPLVLNLGREEGIEGADVTIIHLASGAGGREAYASKVGPSQQTRNLLFIAGPEKRAHWLFKDNKGLVLGVHQLKDEGATASNSPTRVVLIESVAKDSNGDGSLSEADSGTLGLTKPDGTGYRSILEGAEGVVLRSVDREQRVSIVYMRGKVLRHALFAPGDFAPVSDKVVVEVPGAL